MKDEEKQIEEMVKLKTCPFCGGKAHIKIVDHDSHGKESYKVIISCGTWNCDVKREFFWFNTKKQAIQCSIDLWNNRVDEPKLPKDSIVFSKEEAEDKVIITKKEYDKLKYTFNCGYPVYKQGLKEGSKETAEKFIKECKKYKVKKFSPIGIDQRDVGVSWIEMPEWKLEEFAKQFGIKIKE